MSIKNMFESILSDDGGGDEPSTDLGEADDEMTDGGGLMAEEGGDEFGDLGGLDDGDGFGDDEFGDMDEAGTGNDELEHRLEELENEMGSLSSTVNTVRTENEQISDSVEEVEENVRKLLDIYEMVTRGVNPFADDIEAGMGGEMGDGSSFGLFADEGDDGGGEDLDENIAEADAEGFFDEDLVEETTGAEPDAGGSVDDMFPEDDDESESTPEPEATFDEDFDVDDDFEDEAETEDEGGDGGGGKSFQELKDEYDQGDAEWAGGEGEDEDGTDADGATEDGTDADDATEDGTDADEAAEDGADAATEDGEDPGAGLEDDELFDEVIEDDGFESDEGTSAAVEPDEQPDLDEVNASVDDGDAAPDTTDQSASDGTAKSQSGGTAETSSDPASAPSPAVGQSGATGTSAGTPATTASPGATETGKPYLASLPGGFATDMIVVEWLEYLTDASGYRETARAIDYYEDIDWISPDVADELQEYLRGFDDVAAGGDGLTIDDHTTSLEYISQLDGGGGASAAVSKLLGGGGGRGLQR